MIDEIRIQNGGQVYYYWSDDAPEDADEQMAEAGYPTNPTQIRQIIEQS